MHPGPGRTPLFPSPGNYSGDGLWAAHFLAIPVLSERKPAAESKEGRGGKRAVCSGVLFGVRMVSGPLCCCSS